MTLFPLTRGEFFEGNPRKAQRPGRQGEWAIWPTGVAMCMMVRRLETGVGSPTSTFDVLQQARQGDREAFSRLFGKVQRRLAVLIHFQLSPAKRHPEEVDDVMQETLLRAWRDIDRFEYQSAGSFVRWLAAIARHVVLDRARYEGRERRRGVEVGFRSESNPAGAEPADTCTPSRVFARQEAVERLIGQLDELPEDYRDVILLARVEGLSTGEVAERMGRSREQVSVLLYRALKRLRGLREGGGVE